MSYNLKQERMIYAFVADEEVKYIGICNISETTLENRMGRYKNRTGGSTNKRIAEEIKNCLDQGIAIKIFALNPKPLIYKDIEIDLVKGLENPLINKLNPDWNIQK